MAASVNDLFQKLGSASSLVNTPKVTATRAAAGTTLTVDTCNWDTTTGKIFATYQVDTSGNVVSNTETIWKGVVNSSTSIGSLVRIAGAADTGNAIGDYVELLPASAWANNIVAGILTQHNQDGTHAAITATGLTVTSANLTTPKVTTSINDSSGNEVIKTPATASAVNEVTVTNAATGTAPQLSATGDDTNIDLKIAGKGTGVPWLVGGKIKGLVGARQGGSSTVYSTVGTTNQTSNTDEAIIQVGAVTMSAGGDVTVTFPTAFAQIPLVFGTANSASGASTFAVIITVSATQFTARLYTGSARQAENLAWLAIGPVA